MDAETKGAESFNKTTEMPSARQIRYAVVGLGYLSQVAILPAFEHAQENSELAALVSGDPGKTESTGKEI